MNSLTMLRRNPATAREVERILGLPDEAWSEVQIRFGTEEPAMATVEMFLRPDQLTALTALACQETNIG